MCYPLFGIIVTLALYYYMRHIYGKVINNAEDHVNLKYNDIEFNQNDMITNSGVDPQYIIHSAKILIDLLSHPLNSTSISN